jgi:hypothetical protein
MVGAIPPDEMKGISLAAPVWIVSGVKDDVSRFLRALPILVSSDGFLFLEGGAYSDALRDFLKSETVEVSPRPALGTVWPRQGYAAIPATARVLGALAALSEGLPSSEVCTHLHVFRGEKVLLSGYDAFSGEFWLSADVPEEKVRSFAETIGGTYRRDGNASAG